VNYDVYHFTYIIPFSHAKVNADGKKNGQKKETAMAVGEKLKFFYFFEKSY
jgi:hypothetical protein